MSEEQPNRMEPHTEDREESTPLARWGAGVVLGLIFGLLWGGFRTGFRIEGWLIWLQGGILATLFHGMVYRLARPLYLGLAGGIWAFLHIPPKRYIKRIEG